MSINSELERVRTAINTTQANLISSINTSVTTKTATNLESTDNKVTSISSSSTDVQYPSAKSVYTYLGNVTLTSNEIETLNNLLG